MIAYSFWMNTMTSLEQFELDPWKQQQLHRVYERSFLHISPSPETVTGEILLASLYRNVGFKGDASEQVWKLGRPFNNRLEKGKRPEGKESTTGIRTNLWKSIVKRAIATQSLQANPNNVGSRSVLLFLMPPCTLCRRG